MAFIILTAVDRLAEVVTARRLGASIQTAERLADRPTVIIHGFPFVTQVLRGGYGRVSIAARGPVVAQGIRVEDASATMNGVQVRVADPIDGTVKNVPVRSGSGMAVVPYSSLTAAVHRYGGGAGAALAVMSAGPRRARLAGPLGLSVTVSAKVANGDLTIVPESRSLDLLPTPIRGVVSNALAAPIPLPPFPFNIRLAAGRFEPDGLHLMATAQNSLFPVQQAATHHR